jgi:tetratricopeptide (TPR) repeat protein
MPASAPVIDQVRLREIARLPATQALAELQPILNQDTAEAVWRMAYKVATAAGDRAAVIEALRGILSRRPKDRALWNRLGAHLWRAGDTAGVVVLLEAWQAAIPADSNMREDLAAKAFASMDGSKPRAYAVALAAHISPGPLAAALQLANRRQGSSRTLALIGALDTRRLPAWIGQCAVIIKSRHAIADAPVVPPLAGEMEILISVAIALAADQRRKKLSAVLGLLGSSGERACSAPRFNELIAAIVATRSRDLALAGLHLFQATHHAHLRSIVTNANLSGDDELGAAALRRFHQLRPGNWNVLRLCWTIGDVDRREDMIQTLLDEQEALASTSSETAGDFGRNLLYSGRAEESRRAYTRALDSWPGNAELLLGLGEACFWLDEFEEAARAAALAEVHPDCFHRARSLAARICVARSDAAGALENMDAAVSGDGAIYDAFVIQAMMCGQDFERAFDACWRGRTSSIAAAFPAGAIGKDRISIVVRGQERLPGRTAVLGLHGLGDEIKLAQLAPRIAEGCEDALFVCDHRLVPLFRRSFPGLVFEGKHPTAPAGKAGAGQFDRKTSAIAKAARNVVDFKHYLKFCFTRLSDFATDGHPLVADQESTGRWRRRFSAASSAPTIGLFWRSTLHTHMAMHKRSRLSDWIHVLGGLGVTIVPLQYELAAEERALIDENPQLFAAYPQVDVRNDIEELAAMMSALDLVIVLPGTTQHLAGALGAPTFMAAHPYEAGWRRHPETGRDLWAPSVEVISGAANDGLRGSIAATGRRVSAWLQDRL